MKFTIKTLCALLSLSLMIGLSACQKEEHVPQHTVEVLSADTKVTINFNSELGQLSTESSAKAITLEGQAVDSKQNSPRLDWEHCDWDNEGNKPTLLLVVSNGYKASPAGGVHTEYKRLTPDEYTIVLSDESPKKAPQIHVNCEVSLKEGTQISDYSVSALLLDGKRFNTTTFEDNGEIGFSLEAEYLDASKGNRERFSSLMFVASRIPFEKIQRKSDGFVARFIPLGTMLVLQTENIDNHNAQQTRHISIETNGFTRAGVLSFDPTKATNGQKQSVYAPYYSVRSIQEQMEYEFYNILPEVANGEQVAKNRVGLMAIPVKGEREDYYFKVHCAFDDGGKAVYNPFDTFHYQYDLRFSSYYDGKSAYLPLPVGDVINEDEYFRTEWTIDAANPTLSFRAMSMDATKTRIYYRKKGDAGWYRLKMSSSDTWEKITLPEKRIEVGKTYEVIANYLSGFHVNSAHAIPEAERADSEPNLRLITNWGTSSHWRGKGLQFRNAYRMNILARDIPHLERLTSLEEAFRGAESLVANETINEWNVSNVTNMRAMFASASLFNQNLNKWNVAQVTRFDQMFEGATDFNGDISSWDVGRATTMGYMFSNAVSFNQDISGWRPVNNKSLSSTFLGATSFNQALNDWPVSRVKTMHSTFLGATSFNQSLDRWDVSGVEMFQQMFLDASAFNQSLATWQLNSITPGDRRSARLMFSGSGMSEGNVDATLAGWKANPHLKEGVHWIVDEKTTKDKMYWFVDHKSWLLFEEDAN